MKVIALHGTCISYYLPEEKVMIDAGAYTPERVEFLILTHCHCDHLTHANRIIEENRCQVYAGEKDVEALKELNEKVIFTQGLKPIIAKPLKEGDAVNGLRVIETPGHTDGSISLLKEGCLFSGDTLFYMGVGRTDLPSGDYKALLKSLEKLRSVKFKTLYPAH